MVKSFLEMLESVYAVAMITIWRLREPAFIVLVLVGLVVSYWFAGLGSFSADFVGEDLLFGEGAPQGKPVLLGTILLVLLGALVAVFNAAAEIPRDISTRMIAVVMSKPISRYRYIWGKFLGTLGIGLACSFLWISFMLICRLFVGGEGLDVLGVWGGVSQYLCLLLLLPVTGIAVGVSCYFSDIMAMIVTSVYLTFCFAAALFPVVIGLMGQFALGKILLLPYFLFPNLVYFLRSYARLWDYWTLIVYAVCICALFIGLGRAKFGRGDVF